MTTSLPCADAWKYALQGVLLVFLRDTFDVVSGDAVGKRA